MKNGSLRVCSGLEVCLHCREAKTVLLSSDVGVMLHWVGDSFLFDVVLRFEGCKVSYVLYREVYVVKSAV